MEKLNVICVYYNFCNYKRREILTKEYIQRMLKYDKINFYIVELCLENQNFVITNSENKNHLQLKTKHFLWFKENLINICIKKLFPTDWNNVSWIDSDILFKNDNWPDETLEKLKNYDIVQLFSFAHQYDIDNNVIWTDKGVFKHNFGREKYELSKYDCHPGYGWAMTRECYDKNGKIPELFIVGGADTRIAYNIIEQDRFFDTHKEIEFSDEFISYLNNLKNNVKNIKFNYVETEIFHFYHGSFKNRDYMNRHKLLGIYKYNPYTDISYDENGLIYPNEYFNKELLENIKNYFYNRKEDEYTNINI